MRSRPQSDEYEGQEAAPTGPGVQQSEDYDTGETGYKCLGKMPTVGGFFTRDSRHGQP